MVGARAHVAVPSPPTTTTTTPNGIPSAILPRRILFHSPMNAPPPSSSSAFCLTPLNDPPPALLNADGDGDGDRAPKSQPKLAQHHSHHAQALHSMPVQRIGAGLSNLGNTCFLNSVLQCLTYTPPLAAYLQAGLHKGSCRVAGFCAMCTLESHVKQALSAPGRVISPNYLVKNLRCISRSFQMWRQEDAHEYMRYLIEALQKCCPMEASAGGSLSSHKSFIQKIFGGRLRSQVKCTQCSHCSNTYDPFLDLSLEIVRAESLSKALARFTAVEVLDGDNKYQCGTCKKKVRALKQFTIDHAPHVLTVQLKRFSSSGGFGGKIDKKVHFDRTLDLKPFVNTGEEGQLKYSLYAVLVHSGWSTHSGHYYCFVRTAMDMWHVLDDSRVSQVSEKTVLEQKAYILFYTRDMNVLAASNGNHHGKRNRDTAFVVKAQGNNSSCSVKAQANGTTSNAVKAQGNNSSCLAKAQANGTTSNAVKAQVNNISSMSSNRHVNGDKGASSVAKVQVNGTSNISSNSDRDVPHLVEVQANGTLSMNGVSGMTASAPAKASRLVPAEVVLKAIPGNGSGISDSPWLAGKITKMNGSSHLVIEGNRSMELVCSTDTKNIDIEGTMQQKLGGEAARHDDSSFRLSHNGKKSGSDVEMKCKENSSILLPNAATPTLRNTSFETAVPRWSDVEECKGSALEARILPNETQAHCGHVLDEWDEEYDRGKRKKVRNRMAAQQTLQEDSEGFHKHKKRKKMREEGSALLPNSEGCHHGNLFQAVAGSKSQGEVHLAQLKKHKTRQRTFGHKLFLKRHRFKQLGRTPQHRRKR